MKIDSVAPTATERLRTACDGSLQAAFDAEEAADDLDRARPRNLCHRQRVLARTLEKVRKVQVLLELARLDVDAGLDHLEAEYAIGKMASRWKAARETRAA